MSIVEQTPNDKARIEQLELQLNTLQVEFNLLRRDIYGSENPQLTLLRRYVEDWIVEDPTGTLDAKDFELSFKSRVESTRGIAINACTVKGMMYVLFNKSIDDPDFWFENQHGSFYRGLRWKATEQSYLEEEPLTLIDDLIWLHQSRQELDRAVCDLEDMVILSYKKVRHGTSRTK